MGFANLLAGSPAALRRWNPARLAPLVYADARTGLYDDPAAGSAVTANGATVNGWTNQGSAGGRLGKAVRVVACRPASAVPPLRQAPDDSRASVVTPFDVATSNRSGALAPS